jgi:prophage regulatory protein
MAPQLHPPIDVLYRLPKVIATTGLPRSTIYLLIQRGDFPAPVRIGVRAVAWPASAVHGWVAKKIQASQNPGGCQA